MDAAQWSEGLGVVKSMDEKKTIRPQKPQALNCPRCNSAHTKFCYYNNYSLSQPRYFCKTCRRYWTDGGSLRNVPVGGGSRRNKRSSSSSSLPAAASSSIPKSQHHQMMMMAPQAAATLITQNPNINKTTLIQGQGQGQSQGQGQDLNLGYTNISLQFGNLPAPYNNNNNPNTTTTTTTTSYNSSQFSAMELLKSGGFGDNSRHHVMMSSLPNTMIMNSPAGLNFSLDGFDQNGGGMGYHQQHHHHHHHLQGGGGRGGGGSGVGTNIHQSTNMSSTITTTDGTSANARILFPFQDLKPISTSSNSEQLLAEATRGGQGESSSTGYWGTGDHQLGGAGSW